MNRPTNEPTTVRVTKNNITLTWKNFGWTKLVAYITRSRHGKAVITLSAPCTLQTMRYIMDVAERLP